MHSHTFRIEILPSCTKPHRLRLHLLRNSRQSSSSAKHSLSRRSSMSSDIPTSRVDRYKELFTGRVKASGTTSANPTFTLSNTWERQKQDQTQTTAEQRASQTEKQRETAEECYETTSTYANASAMIRNHLANHGAGPPASPQQQRQPLSETTSSSYEIDKRTGEVAGKGEYCPILALGKLPFAFLPHIRPTIRKSLAAQFFDEGKFWARQWNLYYISSTQTESDKPVMFVSKDEAVRFLHEIRKTFPMADIQADGLVKFEGFFLEFDSDHPGLRPHLLGQCTSREHFAFLKDNAPLYDTGCEDEDSLETFRQKLQLAIDAPKNKKYKEEKARQHQTLNQTQLTNVLGFLGLDSPSGTTATDSTDSTKAAPRAFKEDVVFICCDVESYERNHNLVTEVGIAMLDTRDIRDIPPDSYAQNWRSHIQARHFRIKEYLHLKNYRFVQGCPDRFGFGESEIIPLSTAPAKVAECFRPPFKAPTAHNTSSFIPAFSDLAISIEQGAKRNIVLVGHDTKTDIAYLRQIGYDVTNLSSLISTTDTASLGRAAWSSETKNNPPSLAKICSAMEITAWNLHNAGNDAVYTLQGMLGICACYASGMKAP